MQFDNLNPSGGNAPDTGDPGGSFIYVGFSFSGNSEARSLIGPYPSSGDALTFDGVDGYISGSTAFSARNTLSIECWFKTTSSGASNSIWYDNPCVLYYGTGTPTTNRTFGFAIKDGNIHFGGRSTSLEGPAVNDDLPHHAVMSRNGDVISCYLDGELIGTVSGMGTTNSTVQNISIGRRYTASQKFAGTVDEVMVYDVAVDSDLVTAHYSYAEPMGDDVVPEGQSILEVPSSGFIPITSV